MTKADVETPPESQKCSLCHVHTDLTLLIACPLASAIVVSIRNNMHINKVFCSGNAAEADRSVSAGMFQVSCH